MEKFFHKYKAVFWLGVAALLAGLGYTILNLSALPMYVTYTLHQGRMLGVIISVFLMSEALSRPGFGALGDRIGRKPLLLAGPLVTALTAYLTIQFHSPWMLVALRAVDGLGSGALWPAAFATIGDLVEEENRTVALSVLNVTYMGSLALGFLLGGAANDLFNTFNASFYLVTVLMLLAVLVLFFLFPKSAGRPHPHVHIPGYEEPAPLHIRTVFRSFREVPEMVVLASAAFLGMGMLTPIVKLYAVEHLGLSETGFGYLVAPIALVMGVLAIPLGRVGDRFGKVFAICWGLAGAAAAMWLLAIFRSVVLAGVVGVVIGIGFTMAFPAWNALVLSVTSPDRRGEVIGAVGLAQGLAAILGASVGAYIYSSDVLSIPRLGIVNYNVPFWLSALLLTSGSLLAFWWIAGKHGHRDRVTVGKLHRFAVFAAAAAGFLVLVVWIGFRFTMPIPADRVAWSWVQYLARGDTDAADNFVYGADQDSRDWHEDRVDEPAAAPDQDFSERTSRIFRDWEQNQQARYTILPGYRVQGDKARVTVRFVFPGNKREKRIVHLRRDSDHSEWRVYGVSEPPEK